MNLCGINPHHAPPRRPLGDISVGNPYFCNTQTMDSSNSINIDLNLIYQLNTVFMDNNMNILSNDQKDFISTFFYEAGKVTDKLNLKTKDATLHAFDDLSETMVQLDNILAQVLPREVVENA